MRIVIEYLTKEYIVCRLRRGWKPAMIPTWPHYEVSHSGNLTFIIQPRSRCNIISGELLDVGLVRSTPRDDVTMKEGNSNRKLYSWK